jgi:hypothetical protein
MFALAAALGAGSAVAQDAMFIDATGKVGIGTDAPTEQVHVVGTAGVAKFFVEETAGSSFEALMELENEDGNVGFRLRNPQGLADFNKILNEFRINIDSSPAELSLFNNGDLVIRGDLTTGGGFYPDYVFEPDYELMPLDQLRDFVQTNKHLPGVTPALSRGAPSDSRREALSLTHSSRALLIAPGRHREAPGAKSLEPLVVVGC